MIKPKIPIEFWEFIYELSTALIIDDVHDIGKFSYWNRHDHYYHFKKSPHHPSPFHHWQVGFFGAFIAQIGAAITKAMDMKESFDEPINITPTKPPALPQSQPTTTTQVTFDRLTAFVDSI